MEGVDEDRHVNIAGCQHLTHLAETSLPRHGPREHVPQQARNQIAAIRVAQRPYPSAEASRPPRADPQPPDERLETDAVAVPETAPVRDIHDDVRAAGGVITSYDNVVWSPLAGGVLTGKYRSPADIPAGSRASGSDAVFVRRWMDQGLLDAVQQLRSLAERAGCTLPQLALKWCLRQRLVSSVIIGATTTAHVDENAAAADIDVDPDVFTQMDAILAPWAITDPRATG